MGILKSIADFFVPAEAASRPQIERNEPCWCGSGKKYKKCHLHEDEEKARKSGANCRTA